MIPNIKVYAGNGDASAGDVSVDDDDIVGNIEVGDDDFVRKPPEMQNSTVTLDTALLGGPTDNVNGNGRGGAFFATTGTRTNADYLFQVEPGITYSKQDELPRLPIPTLDETLNKLLLHLEALQTEEEKSQAQEEVLEFMIGDGPVLQQLLLEYDQEGLETGLLGSYIEEFWNDSYLVPDQSVVLNLNPFFVLEDGPDPKTAKDPLKRAASLCFAAVKLASTIREETFLPDTFKDNPLCMDQFKAVFGTARVPHLTGDDIDVYPSSSHVVVFARNQVYYFQALWPDGTVAVDEEDILEILSAIDKNAKLVKNPAESARTCPGVLTSLGRREWAKIRIELEKDASNQQFLTIVDSGLFVLVLDTVIPQNVNEAASNMLHGTHTVDRESSDPVYPGSQTGSCCNRWYDKLQIIVCGDGTAGINFEHSTIDGHTALRVVSDIYAETVVNFAQSITKSIPAHSKIPHVIDASIERANSLPDDGTSSSLDILPKKITINIPERIQRKIFHAETALGDEIIASDTEVLEFRDYGKKLITANNLSPDSYVQMSMMLAYYKVYGKMVCGYEPVLTKSFYHGRTEAMRPTTVPAKELCNVFFDTNVPPQQKLASLRRAVTVHSQFVRECAAGKGVDRHLFALKAICEKHQLPVPNFFHSKAWHMLNHTILSTSNCGNPSLRLFGFGPVVPDGYGIGYIIKDHSLSFSVSSKRRQTRRYTFALNAVLKDMARLLRRKGKTFKAKVVGTTNSTSTRGRRVGRERSGGSASYGDMWGAATEGTTSSGPPAYPDKAATVPAARPRKQFGIREFGGADNNGNVRDADNNGNLPPAREDAATGGGGHVVISSSSRTQHASNMTDSSGNTHPPPDSDENVDNDSYSKNYDSFTEQNTIDSDVVVHSQQSASVTTDDENFPSISGSSINNRDNENENDNSIDVPPAQIGPPSYYASSGTPVMRNRKFRGRKSAPAAVISEAIAADASHHQQHQNRRPSDIKPMKPQRRGSMFSRMSERESLSQRQLSESGLSLEVTTEEENETDFEYS